MALNDELKKALEKKDTKEIDRLIRKFKAANIYNEILGKALHVREALHYGNGKL